MKYGYARVSTQEQDLGRQVAELERYGCDQVFTDKISGMKESRPEFDKVLNMLRKGDCLAVHKLDRLGRNAIHLQTLIQDLSARGVSVVSISENFDFSTTMGKAMFAIMCVLAEMERNTIRDRVVHGLAHAKAKGVKLGRIEEFSKYSDQAIEMRKAGYNFTEIAQKLGINRRTVKKAVGLDVK